LPIAPESEDYRFGTSPPSSGKGGRSAAGARLSREVRPEPPAPIAAGRWHRGGTLRAWGRTELPRAARASLSRNECPGDGQQSGRIPRSTAPGLVVLSLTPRELPARRFVTGAAALDKPHRGEDAAVEGAAHRRPLLIDGATPLTEMNASSVRAPLEHQLTIRAPLGQQVGQALPIALLVHDDAGVVAAGGACAAGDRPRVSAPPGREEVPRSAVH
jgi:hypothetical protein